MSRTGVMHDLLLGSSTRTYFGVIFCVFGGCVCEGNGRGGRMRGVGQWVYDTNLHTHMDTFIYTPIYIYMNTPTDLDLDLIDAELEQPRGVLGQEPVHDLVPLLFHYV